MGCYSHLSDDEREQIGLAEALGHSIGESPSDRREVMLANSGNRLERSYSRLRSGAINCAGGVKRRSKEIEPYGPSL